MAKKPVRDLSHVRAFRALLRSHARITDLVKQRVMERCGVSMSEFDMIAELGNQPALRMSALAEKMITSPGNVTRVAQALEAKGLVRRARAAHSDREVVAELTPAGNAFFHKHFLEMVDVIEEIWDASLSKPEQVELGALLEQLARPPT